MSTNAGELLEIMKIRLGMQEDGVTNLSKSVKSATKALVEKLSLIDSSEKITIEIPKNNEVYAKYIRKITGEILAQIEDNENT